MADCKNFDLVKWFLIISIFFLIITCVNQISQLQDNQILVDAMLCVLCLQISLGQAIYNE